MKGRQSPRGRIEEFTGDNTVASGGTPLDFARLPEVVTASVDAGFRNNQDPNIRLNLRSAMTGLSSLTGTVPADIEMPIMLKKAWERIPDC